jgi:DNA (cytosine-5)-methyltransferase 1
MRLTYGSLFAGVGGFDMGFERAGFVCRFQVEWDTQCQSILNRHWPEVSKWGDVRRVDGSLLPSVDVLIFGSPCQDLSVAGKRSGLDGGRSSMFFEAIRIIKEMRSATGNTYPRIVVWENVPGALSSNRGADFQAVLNEMGDCGSHLTEWAVLDAQHFGVSQRRRRVFLVAVLDPSIARRCADPIFAVAEGSRGDYQKGIKKRQGVTDSTAGSSAVNFNGYNLTAVRDTQHSFRAGTHETNRVVQTISFGWQENFYAGETYDEITTALTTTKTPAVQTEYAVRRLTPLECERLMGWPDDHTRWQADGKEQADSHRYKQCGNGVVTPVAHWLANQIKAQINN